MTETQETSSIKSVRYVIAAALAGVIVFFTSSLAPNQAVVLATLTVAVVLWVSEAIPLFVTSLLASLLLLASGHFKTAEVFSPYFDPVIVLFLGGFILSAVLQKHGLDEVIAQVFLRKFSGSGRIFILGVMLISAFLSMWMSNTAAAAVMLPIGISVLKRNQLFSKDSRFAKATVLAIAYAASIGGIGTLIGSPPNAIASRYLADKNIHLDFNGWLITALPFVVLALIAAWAILVFTHKIKDEKITIHPKSSSLNHRQILVLVIFSLTVLGWLTSEFTGFSASTVALLPICLAFIFGLLEESDLNQVSWSTLLLFGGGLSLGSAVSKTELDAWLASLVQPYLSGIPLFWLLLALVFFGIFVTMIASNTASAAILIPVMLPLAGDIGLSAKTIVVLIAIGVSLDFMMPVGTPPSALAYSTKVVNVREMIRSGVLVNIVTGFILCLLFYFFYL